MSLETGTYISDLVATNPVGATDQKSQGDDHIRLLKSTIKATFPNITGAVTPTHTAINQTCVGTGGAFPAINGSALTALNASNLGSGTVPDARFPATLPALNGSALTNLAAANLTGTIADARLSANVPLLNAANVFGAIQTVTNDIDSKAASPAFNLRTAGGTLLGRFYSSSGDQVLASENSGAELRLTTAGGGALKLNGVDVTDFVRLSQSNTFTGTTQSISHATAATFDTAVNSVSAAYFGANASGLFIVERRNLPLEFDTNNTTRLVISSGGNFDFKGGTVTRNDASASEVGKAGRPSRSVSASANTAATDQGGAINLTGGVGQTFTLDSDPPTDAEVLIINSSGNSWTIAASGTLTVGTGTGSKTLSDGSTAIFHHFGSGNWRSITVSGSLA